MKFATKEQNVAISDGMEVRNFGIVSSSKMFKILSDGLYSNKIRAIIRELSTNAEDAHKANGNPEQPFEIHLPSYSNSNFWIRDYGTGMSPETVQKVYTWYGASDRDKSNEFAGMMGLGSKTPFCYGSRSFTCETWYDGIHYTYSCFLDHEGKPAIAKMYEEESDEPTGTKISFSADSYDGFKFKTEARDIYKYFDVKPRILGDKVTLEDQEYILQGSYWKLRSKDHKGCQAIMGSVAYPITLDDIPGDVKNIVRGDFDIFFKIGELDVEASREGLSYDNRTTYAIKLALKRIAKEINKIMDEKVEQADSLWQARCLVNDLFESLPRDLFRATKFDELTWKGQKIFTGLDCSVKIDIQDKDFELTQYRREGRWNKKIITIRTRDIHPKIDLDIYENDMKTGFKVRAKSRCLNTDKPVVLVNFPNNNIRQKFYDQLGFKNGDATIIKKISSLPSPTYNGGRKSGSVTEDVMEFNDNGYKPTNFWKNTQINFADGGIYIEWKRYKGKINGRVIDADIVKRILNNISKLGIKIPTIYGIKSKQISKVISNPKWTNFSEWVSKILNDEESKINVCQIKHDQQELACISGYNHKCVHYHIFRVTSIQEAANDIKEFVEHVETVRQSTRNLLKADACVSIRSLLGLKSLDTPIIERNLLKTSTELSKKYKLLRYVDEGRVKDFVDELLLYIKAKGESNVSKLDR